MNPSQPRPAARHPLATRAAGVPPAPDPPARPLDRLGELTELYRRGHAGRSTEYGVPCTGYAEQTR